MNKGNWVTQPLGNDNAPANKNLSIDALRQEAVRILAFLMEHQTDFRPFSEPWDALEFWLKDWIRNKSRPASKSQAATIHHVFTIAQYSVEKQLRLIISRQSTYHYLFQVIVEAEGRYIQQRYAQTICFFRTVVSLLKKAEETPETNKKKQRA